MQKLLKKEHT
jgi:WD40 repeat protein